MQRMSVGVRPVAAAMLACLWSLTAHAADPVLPSVTVQEAQEALDPALVPYATEVVTKEDIERKQILDIRDAVRDMINVEVPRVARRGSGISGTGVKATQGLKSVVWAATVYRPWWTAFLCPNPIVS